MRSAYSPLRSSPGQTATRSASSDPDEVHTRGSSIQCTLALQTKVTPCASASHAAIRGIACRDSTRSSVVLSSTAASPGARSCGNWRRASAGVRIEQPSAISVPMKASSTATDSGRRAVIHKPRWTIGTPAAAATSSQTSRVRRARDHIVPRSWPVTVTNPKLRTDAPFACASRSTTTTRKPRRTAASAVARPMMPAPTTARSKRPESVVMPDIIQKMDVSTSRIYDACLAILLHVRGGTRVVRRLHGVEQILRAHRAAEEIALSITATQRLQYRALRGILDAFLQTRHAEVFNQE